MKTKKKNKNTHKFKKTFNHSNTSYKSLKRMNRNQIMDLCKQLFYIDKKYIYQKIS